MLYPGKANILIHSPVSTARRKTLSVPKAETVEAIELVTSTKREQLTLL